MESLNENPLQSRSRSAVVVTSREQELQKLLSEERVRSDQRKTNYSTLKEEHLKLQKDFLTLQTEIRQILSETKQIKDTKDQELDQLVKACEERDKLIDGLKNELKERDPQLIRNQFEDELREPLKKLEKSNEMMARDKERISYELRIAKQKIQFLEKESLDSMERIKLSFESEINSINRQKEEIRNQLIETKQLPDIQKVSDLTQENHKLNAKLKSYQTTLEEAEQQYKKIDSKVEALVVQHECSEKEYEKQISSLNSQLNALRENNSNLRQHLNNNTKDKEELMADLERMKNEINRLNKELEEKDKQFLTEKEKIKNYYLKDNKEIEVQKDIISDDLKKFKLEFKAKSEAMNRLEEQLISKDREYQQNMSSIRAQEFEKRCAIEREKDSMQTRIKDLKEEKSKLKEEIQQMKRQIENLSELRLTVERDSMILRAKVESYQLSIEELEQLRRQHIQLHDNLNKLKTQNMEYSALNKEMVRQKEQYKSDYQRIKDTLEEERKQLDEFKVSSDKNVHKLKNCIEEERNDFRDKLLSLEREVIKCKKEKEELRTKYKQYVLIADKLQTKLTEMKEKQQKKVESSSHHKSSQLMASSAPTVSVETHNQLKKELKLLKKRQNEMSNLLNCSFDSTHCKELDVKPVNDS